MDIDRIYDDVILHKTKYLTYDERDEIIDEIIRISELVRAKERYSNRHKEMFEIQEDSLLVGVLKDQYLLFAVKHFMDVGKQP